MLELAAQTQLHAALSLEELNRILEEQFAAQLGAAGFSIFFYDEAGDDLCLSYSYPDAPDLTADCFVDGLPLLRESYGAGACGLLDWPGAWPADYPEPLASAPLVFREEPFGLLVLHGDHPLLEGTDDPERFQDLVTHAAGEIIKLQLYESVCDESEAAGKKIDAINHIAGMLRNLDLEILLTKLMELSLEIVNAQVGSIIIRRDQNLETKVDFGLQDPVMKAIRTGEGGCFIQEVMDRGEPVLIEDVSSSEEIDVSALQVVIKSYIGIPLVTRSKKLGLISIVNGEDGFDPKDFENLTTISNLAASAVENAILQEKQIESERLWKEMDIARKIQSSLIPSGFHEFGAFQIHGWSLPCEETGGDYFDYIPLDEDRIALVLGDVSGHGLGAALLMFIARTALQTLLHETDDLAQVFYSLNNRVFADSEQCHFMTMFCGILDKKKKTLQYISAGHEGPMWHSPSQGFLRELESTDFPLGIVKDHAFNLTEVYQIQTGDVLLLGTDGIWEAANKEKEQFGKARVRELILANAQDAVGDLSVAICSSVYEFIADANQMDDITLMVGKFIEE